MDDRAWLRLARGQWLTPRIIAWPRASLPLDADPEALDWTLHASPTGGIDPWAADPVPWRSVSLAPLPGGLWHSGPKSIFEPGEPVAGVAPRPQAAIEGDRAWVPPPPQEKNFLERLFGG